MPLGLIRKYLLVPPVDFHNYEIVTQITRFRQFEDLLKCFPSPSQLEGCGVVNL